MNKIQTVEATGLYEWEVSTTIDGKDIPLDFTLFGCTFEDGTKKKTITPNASDVYTFKLKGQAPESDMRVQHAVVQYDDFGLPVTLQEASRNIVRPVSNIIDFRLQTQGFESLPLGVVPSSGINMILGQVDELTEFDPDLYVKLEELPTGAPSFDQAITVYFDKFRKVRYWLANIHTDTPTVVKKDTLDLVDCLMRYNPTTKMRQIIDVFKDGKLHVYAVGTNYTTYDLKCKPTRAKFFGQALRVIDSNGTLRVYDGLTFVQSTQYADNFYTDFSDGELPAGGYNNVAITREGKLVALAGDPAKVKIANDSGMFFYHAGQKTNKFYGYDPLAKTTIQVFDWEAQTLTPRAAMTPERVLEYRTLASVSGNGAAMTAGSEYVPESEQIFIGVTSNPYEGDIADRRLGYFLTDVQDLKHITTPDYNSVIPAFNVELGQKVKAKFRVTSLDTDMALPITLPESVTWKATINGVETKTARSGDEIEIEMESPELTFGYYPISVGRSSGLIEIVPDSMPDPFTFKSVHEQPENFWYSTEEITITGINVRVPLTLTVNEGVDYTRFKIYVNGQERQMPVYIFNNDKLRLDVYHETFQTRVEVTVGDRTSKFGVYTIDELPIPPLTNWCYVPSGKKVTSDPILNDSPADLDLTITTGNATFSNGLTTIKLAAGKSTNIIHVAEPNTKATIGFKSVVYSYEWKVWSDNVWLDLPPAEKRSTSMTFDESPAIKFDAIPVTEESKWKTVLRVPSGILLTVGTEQIDHELDSRSVYLTPFELEIDVQDLEIGAYPRTTPYGIQLGDAVVEWDYLYTTDPTYEQGLVNVQTIAQRFKNAVAEVVTTTKSVLTSAYRHTVTKFNTRARAAMVLAQTFEQEFESVDITIQTMKNLFVGIKTEHTTFDQSATSKSISVRYFDQKMKKVYIEAVTKFQTGDPRYLYDRHSLFEATKFIYQVYDTSYTPPFGAEYQSYRLDKSETQLTADYQTDSTWMTARNQIAKWNHDIWYYIGRTEAWKYQTKTDNKGQMTAIYLHLNDAYKIGTTTKYTGWTQHVFDSIEARWVGLNPNADSSRWLRRAAHSTGTAHWFNIEVFPAWIKGSVKPILTNQHKPAYVEGSIIPVEPFGPVQISEIHHWIGRELDTAYIPNPTYVIEMDGKAKYVQQLTTSGDAITLTPNFIATYVTTIPNESMPRKVEQQVIPAVSARKKSAKAKVVLELPKRKFTAPMDELSEGKTDPLENGYFPTEQQALRNAVTVWGNDPSAVRAAQRPDGTWYWIKEIPCDNSCGAYSCDTAGYLSGG